MDLVHRIGLTATVLMVATTLIGSTLRARLPNIAHAILLSVFLLSLGSTSLAIGIMDPHNIRGAFSIMGCEVPISQKTHSTVGAVVFMLAGSICIGIVPFIWRHYIREGLVQKWKP